MDTPKYPISKVETNREKGESYRENFQRFNKAKSFSFYLECLWILYAMLEDRTSAFLYYIGFASSEKRSSVTGSKKIKPQIRSILGMIVSNEKYKFDSISGKLRRIQQVLSWSTSEESADSPYKETLRKVLRPLAETDEINTALSYLQGEWREKRNQLTHSLFIKKPDAVMAELQPLVENGCKSIRVIDKAVREIKKHDIPDKIKHSKKSKII